WNRSVEVVGRPRWRRRRFDSRTLLAAPLLHGSFGLHPSLPFLFLFLFLLLLLFPLLLFLLQILVLELVVIDGRPLRSPRPRALRRRLLRGGGLAARGRALRRLGRLFLLSCWTLGRGHQLTTSPISASPLETIGGALRAAKALICLRERPLPIGVPARA